MAQPIYVPVPPQNGMSTGTKLILAIFVLAALYIIFKENVDAFIKGLQKPKAQVPVQGPVLISGEGPVKMPISTQVLAPQPKWMFYKGLDSNGGDIGNFPGSLTQIKAKCESLPDCKGFNDNGWLKNVLLSRNLWSKWTDDPNKGFRINVNRVPDFPSNGTAEFD